MARGQGYDQEAALRRSLTRPVTEGARPRQMFPLSYLKTLHEENPGSVVVISDVHAQISLLYRVLLELGLIDKDNNRLQKKTTLVQIGDLIDGRDLNDEETLTLGGKWFDIIIAGNHEAAYLGGPHFMRWQYRPMLTHGLRSLHTQQKLLAAYEAHGVVLTHAGLHPDFWYTEYEPARLTDEINKLWNNFMRDDQAPHPEFFQQDTKRQSMQLKDPFKILDIDRAATKDQIQEAYEKAKAKYAEEANVPERTARLADVEYAKDILENAKEAYLKEANKPGGSMWMDWEALIDGQDQKLRQIVGHSPRGRMEETLDGKIINLDMAGSRLGVAVILPNGEIYTGSDQP